MFDPKKLDLDLENLDKSSENTDKNQEEKPQNPLQENTEEVKEEKSKTEEAPAEEKKEEPKVEVTPIEEEKEEEPEIPSIIYDINITSLDNILNLVLEQKYDFVTLTPTDEAIKISFFSDKVERDTKYIKYPIYSHILIQAKTKAALSVEVSDEEQEGKGNITLKNTSYKLLAKTIPGKLGEKIFIKLAPGDKKEVAKVKKQISLGQILWTLGAGLTGILVVGGVFLTFVLMNSSNVADLTFFNNLGVDVGSIKDFTSKLVDGVFFSIIFIETILLFVFTFKTILTKKQFKKKRITRGIIASLLLILVLISGTIWITLSQKINALKGINYGKIEYFDNSKYLSPLFDENGSQVNINERLIGPITIRFDIEEFIQKLIDDGFTPNNITWVFPDENIVKPVEDYEVIKEFSEKGLQNVTLKLEGTNLKGEETTLEETIADINIANIVTIKEQKVSNGGSIFHYDATDLKQLGKIKWYYIPDLKGKDEVEQNQIVSEALSKEILEGYEFSNSKIIFDEEVILGMKIITKSGEKDELDKVFIMSKTEKDTIEGKIEFKQSLTKDFEYELKVSNVSTDFGEGVIESFTWKIGDKEITKVADLINLDNSSKITYTFPQYGENTVSVFLNDSRGQIKEFQTIINIPKRLKLQSPLKILHNGGEVEKLKYEAPHNTYYIDEIGVPGSIQIDTKGLKANDLLYTLQEVKWDVEGDGDTDSTSKAFNYQVNTEGNHIIDVYLKFAHRIIKDDTITVKETILIEGIKKEAILNIDIKKESNYVPITVGFDASKSQVKNENIVKFIWDYGDGIIEERDAIVPGHKYTVKGDYIVKLKVITESGKEYEISKKLILKPRQQSVEITSSLKKAPIHQGIDFLSDKSEGQITGYFWDFGDGETSVEANPTHSYTKSGKYTVSLKLDFSNNNILEDVIEIEIYDE